LPGARGSGTIQPMDPEDARKALAVDFKALAYRHFLSGETESPFPTAAGRTFFERLARGAATLVDDPGRAEQVRAHVAEILGRIDRKEGFEEVARLAHHVLLLLLPGAPELFQEALQDAKYELARRSEAPEGGGLLFKSGIVVALERVEAGFQDGLLERIQRLTVADLEPPERATIEGLDGDVILFGCAGCGQTARAPLGQAGDDIPCACGDVLSVPVPSWSRLLAARAGAREAAMGIARCRICGARVQTRRDAMTRAGFCSPMCLKQGRERFQEVVARTGRREGDDVLFTCACGAELRASMKRAGTPAPCKACGLKVWAPDAPPAAAPGGPRIRACGSCGRNVKSAAARCFYCGTPVA
jgi:hypothetical protein